MKSYSCCKEEKGCAFARMEGTDASYKDLAEVCGRIRGRDAEAALLFLEKVADGEVPVLYKRHNKRLGHRRELGGKKGRYPQKAAEAVLKTLKSALANGRVKGLGESYTVIHAAANKKYSYPRMAAKGRRSRQCFEIARIEIILRGDQGAADVAAAEAKQHDNAPPNEKAESTKKRINEG